MAEAVGHPDPTPAATPEVAALATAARQTTLLPELVGRARWTATPRAVTPTGALGKPELLVPLEAHWLPGSA